jgi:hypothetical protein
LRYWEHAFDDVWMAAEPASAIGDLVERIRPLALRHEQQGLPLLPALGELLPGGVMPGSVVTVSAAPGVLGATTLALALVAGPSQAGAWVALVGGPRRGSAGWGLVAAAELGVELERLVVVAASEPPAGGWARVIVALLDGFPVVVLGPQVRLHHRDTRRLAARLRERGGVLVRTGSDAISADVRLVAREVLWEGVDRFESTRLLQRRRIVVEASGRGAASRARQAEISLPATG